MGTDLNFGAFGGRGGGGGSGPMGRQSSIFSLTLDELQNSVGGSIGKDFGSMNMDELLKNIWSAEEMQTMATSCGSAAVHNGVGGGLQKQGSLTLPRTLSQKTVDEIWKDVHGGGNDGSGCSGLVLQQKQQTLKEITLEEFLVKAGVVREDVNVNNLQALATSNNNNNNGGPFYSEFQKASKNNSNTGHGVGFPSLAQGLGVGLSSQLPGAGNQIHVQAPILPLNVNGARSSQQSLLSPRSQQKPQLFPKQPDPPGYAGQMNSGSQLASPRVRGGLVGMSVHNNMVQGSGLGMVGLGGTPMNIVNESSPSQLSSDGAGKFNGDLTSVSPVPYVFSGGIRGRRANGALEKVVERRQRRMIKNRESAARSRARKQAYTMELEAEVAKLKAENQELQRKQEEIMKLQENQVMETMPPGPKRQRLRRAQSSPW
ncbi:unnamed protein product [Rhodiola kirilowii]